MWKAALLKGALMRLSGTLMLPFLKIPFRPCLVLSRLFVMAQVSSSVCEGA